MKFVVCALLFLALFVGSFASVYDIFYRNAKHPGKCVYWDVIISPGEQGEPTGRCQRLTCAEDLSGKVETCDELMPILEPPCLWGEPKNPEAAFPECCAKHVVCP